MKRFYTILFLIMALNGQAQILQKGIKVNYGLNKSLSQLEVKDWKSELVNSGDVGLMARVNVWRLYLQAEAYVGINSWRTESSDVSDMITEWTKSVGLTVPMLVGYKVGSTEARSNFRIFAGPVFNRLMDEHEYEMFSSVVGVGFDIVGRVSVDARYMMMFREQEMFESSAHGLQLSLILMF